MDSPPSDAWGAQWALLAELQSLPLPEDPDSEPTADIAQVNGQETDYPFKLFIYRANVQIVEISMPKSLYSSPISPRLKVELAMLIGRC